MQELWAQNGHTGKRRLVSYCRPTGKI
jgi:hypothetical protein